MRTLDASPTSTSRQEWLWIGIAALIGIIGVAYVPAMSAGFIWDDDAYVTANSLLRNFEGLRRIWIPRETPQYYPAVFTTFWIEYQLWGLNPTGYHIINILLHAINAVLVWRLCKTIGIPGGDAAGWLIAAVFALHPVHVESVAWITERKNVLSGFFYLAAMLAYLKFDSDGTERKAANGPTHAPWRWYAIALGLFILALLSKTVTCSLPAALLLIFLYQRKPLTLRRVGRLVPFFVIGAALAMVTVKLEVDHVGAEGDQFAFTLAQRLLIASQALLFYPWKIVWPWPLMFIYPRWTIDASTIASFWAFGVVVLAGIAALIAYLRNWRGPALALAFYAGTIFPALGFFNIYPMKFSFVADHFQYLASLGIIALIVGGAAWLLGGGWRLIAIGSLPLLVFLILTINQTTMYESEETLWTRTLERNETAWLAHNNLSKVYLTRAVELRNQDRKAESDQALARGYEHLCRAMELHYPLRVSLVQTDPKLCLVLGAYFDRKNLIDDAIDFYVMFLKRYPEESPVYVLLGDVLLKAGRMEYAVNQFRNAVTTARNYNERKTSQEKLASSLVTMAAVRASQGDLKAADELAREAATMYEISGQSELSAAARRQAQQYQAQMQSRQ